MDEMGQPARQKPPGRREANKQAKLQRIRAAAREVFLNNGYEAATMREISAKAQVAFGTLFLYAKNKQDMLLLLFDEELPKVGERALAHAETKTEVIDQIVTFLAELYIFFSETPSLSRDMLREITFSNDGIVASRIWTSVQNLEARLSKLVAQAQANGQISAAVSPGLASHVIFSLHRVELRFCMDRDDPDIEASLDNLRRQIEILFAGLEPRSAQLMERTGVPSVFLPGARRRKSA